MQSYKYYHSSGRAIKKHLRSGHRRYYYSGTETRRLLQHYTREFESPWKAPYTHAPLGTGCITMRPKLEVVALKSRAARVWKGPDASRDTPRATAKAEVPCAVKRASAAAAATANRAGAMRRHHGHHRHLHGPLAIR